jgi:hypothetical protein
MNVRHVPRPSRRTLKQELRALGESEAPGADAGFVTGLAVRLAADAAVHRRIALVGTRRRRRIRPLPVLTSAAAVVAGLVLVGALDGWFGQTDADVALALAGAVDTTVVLPDGSSIEGHSGLTLPDGSVVRTGPNGRAAAGSVEIGPGLEALVEAGRLRLRTAAPSGGPTVEVSLPASTEPPPDVTTTSLPVTTTTVPSTLVRLPDPILRMPGQGR